MRPEKHGERNAEIRRMRAAGWRTSALAGRFGLAASTVSNICAGEERRRAIRKRGADAYRENVAAGLCGCGGERRPGKLTCERCAEKTARADARKAAKRVPPERVDASRLPAE